jgi:hypothetical protein
MFSRKRLLINSAVLIVFSTSYAVISDKPRVAEVFVTIGITLIWLALSLKKE